MKKKILIFFFILISCSKKEELVDIDAFISEGKKIKIVEENFFLNNNVSLINNLKIKKKTSNIFYKKNQNLIHPVNLSIGKKNKSLSINIVAYSNYMNKLVLVDSSSNLSIYDEDLKKIKSIKIYKKKIYKNNKINYKILVENNRIFLSDTLGNIHVFSFENLEVLWKKNLSVPFLSDMKIYKNDLYLINSNSKIFSINYLNGNLNWSFETASKKIKNHLSYQISLFKNNLFFTNDNGELFNLDLSNGNILWSISFEGENFKKKESIFKSSKIVINDEVLYLSNNFGFFYAINFNSGSIIWQKPFYSLSDFVISSKYIFLKKENQFIVLNKKTGNILYNKSFQSKILNFLILRNQICLFIEDYFLLLNQDNLSEYNSIKINSSFKNYIIIGENIFFISHNKIVKFS